MNSNLQIISGELKGRKLKIPTSARPTQNRARVAVFNIINGFFNKDDKIHVWDAFAGSGAFGFEILSEYINSDVLFSDKSIEAISIIRENLAKLEINSRAKTDKTDTISVINKYIADMDLIFLDPPYADNELGMNFVQKWIKNGKNGSVLIWEQDNSNSVLPNNKNIEILRDKKYGRARFIFMRKNND